MSNHDDPYHIYHRRRNPSGCDKFYCLYRFSRWWRFRLTIRESWRRRYEGPPA